MSPDLPTDPKNYVASVAKAIHLLELFSDTEPQLTLAQLIARGGFTRTTTHRLCSTLEHVGWLQRSGDGYRLSLSVFRLGSVAVNTLQLRQEASHDMSMLSTLTGADVYLVVADGPRAVCLERIEGKTTVHDMTLDVGRSLPLYLGGGPVALLAEGEQELLPRVLAEGSLKQPTGGTFSEEMLREKLRETRALGYSRSIEDVTMGIGAFGAAIYNSRGIAVAALSIGGLVGSLLEREEELSTALRHAASHISANLGYLPDDSRA